MTHKIWLLIKTLQCKHCRLFPETNDSWESDIFKGIKNRMNSAAWFLKWIKNIQNEQYSPIPKTHGSFCLVVFSESKPCSVNSVAWILKQMTLIWFCFNESKTKIQNEWLVFFISWHLIQIASSQFVWRIISSCCDAVD